MPIQFRCPSCYGLLSIARRKAGKEVACPKCGDAVIVPEDDGSAEEEDPFTAEILAEVEAERAAEAPPPRRTEPPPPPAPRERPPAPKREPAGVAAESRSVPPPLDRKARVESKPAPEKSGKDEPPLFERADFEQLLNPAVKKATMPPASPSPATGTRARGLSGTVPQPPSAATQPIDLAHGEKGIFISHSSAVMLAIMVFVLLGLAFAAGFLVGS